MKFNISVFYLKICIIPVMQSWFFIILTPVISVMWSFRNHSNMLIWCSKTCAISNVENIESAIHFFRLLWWIQSSEGQHLFEMEIFCNIWNVFVVNKVPCWIKLLIYLKKSYWPQTCVWYMLCVSHCAWMYFQEERSVLTTLWIMIFLAGNIVYVYYTFSAEELHNRYSFIHSFQTIHHYWLRVSNIHLIYVILDVLRTLLLFFALFILTFHLLHVVILQSDLSFYFCVYQHLWVFSFPSFFIIHILIIS